MWGDAKCSGGVTLIVTNLGNILDVNDNNKDISVQRGIAIGKVNGVLQEFNFAHPHTKCVVTPTYCTDFYGCESWDFNSRVLFFTN